MAKKNGRPRFEFDEKLVAELATIQCTNSEIAAVCGCSESTLYDRMKTDARFSEIIERAREHGKSSLRRAQWKAAVNGNTTMLIWLGKQMLGQRDKAETMTVDLSTLADDELEAVAEGKTLEQVLNARRRS